MYTVYGEGRGFRVVWLLEELGLPYRLRQVDLLADVSQDTEFLAVNPGGFIPALVGDGLVMVESVAIMQYLLARHGPSPLALGPDDPAFATYLQFLHMGEAGLAGPANAAFMGRRIAPENERNDFTSRWALATFHSRLRLVLRQLEAAPYMAGAAFTAADISVAYALEMAERHGTYVPGETERAYLDRATARPAYARAMDSCAATKAWVAGLKAEAAAG